MVNEIRESADRDDSLEKRAVQVVKDLLFRLCAIMLYCFEAFVFVMFLVGAVEAFGEGITPVWVIDSIIRLFEINTLNAYEYVSDGILSCLYIAFVIKMIKDLVVALRALLSLLGVEKEMPIIEETLRNRRMHTLVYSAFSGLMLVFFLVVVSRLLCTSELNGVLIALMTIAAIVYLLKGIFLRISSSKSNAFDVVLCALKDVIVLFLTGSVFCLLGRAAVSDFVNGVIMAFNGLLFVSGYGGKVIFFLFYTKIIEPVLFIALALMAMNAIRAFYSVSPNKTIMGKLIALLVLSAIMLATTLVFRVILPVGSITMSTGLMSVWFGNVKEVILPVFLLTFGWIFAFGLFQTKKKH